MKKQYPSEYFDLPAAFQCVDQAKDFLAISKLLFEIQNYCGEGITAALFYEAKVTEPIALVLDNQKKQSAKKAHPLFGEDLKGLENVAGYIAELFKKSTGILPIEYRKIAREKR